MDLTEAGVVARTDLGDHVWRFELRTKSGSHASSHPHFVCTDCGTVACLPGVSVSIRAPQSAAAPSAISAHRVQIQLKGVCDSCT
jgi:Fur family transcriptional regulator, ferric uptake regulator